MTGSVSHSTLDQPQGPVNSGPGHQYNFDFSALLDAATTRRSVVGDRDPRHIADDELTRLRRRFIAPRGLGEARGVLRETGTVLITGPDGAGKRSAAKILLCECSRDGSVPRELVDQCEETERRESSRALAPERVEERALLLLDLSGVPENRYRRFMADLPEFRAAVRRCAARLVVVTAPHRGHLLGEGLGELLVPLERPSGREVLLRHLRDQGVPATDDDLSAVEGLAPPLAMAAMEDVARLARLAARVSRAPGAPADVGRLLADALTAWRRSDADVRKLLDQGARTGRQRALLLTVAFLDGCRADAVHAAAIKLLRATRHPAVGVPPFDRAALTEELKEVGATVRADGTAALDEGLAPAVRSYFWRDHPGLRPGLFEWLRHAKDLPALDDGERTALVSRFAAQALRTEPFDEVIELATDWTGPRSTGSDPVMAARLLAEMAGSPAHAGPFRRKAYEWAVSRNSARPLALVLVGVCAETLAVTHPEQAVTRLHHLARHREEEVREQARDALRRVTASDDGLWQRLLNRLCPASEAQDPSPPSSRQRADVVLFHELTPPERLLRASSSPRGRALLSRADVRRRLTGLWAEVLRTFPRTSWEPAVRRWLAGASERPETGAPLLTVLAGACAATPTAFGPVYAVACAWAGEPGVARARRVEVVDALWRQRRAVPSARTAGAEREARP